MDLRQLLTFRTVVDKGSFSQAAEELEVSQPAVSFQIRALEERLGHRLLDRSGRRVRLTEAGEVVYRYARRMIGLEAELEREMGEIGTRVSGRLVLGSSTGPGEVLLPRLLGAFHARAPGREGQPRRQRHPDGVRARPRRRAGARGGGRGAGRSAASCSSRSSATSSSPSSRPGTRSPSRGSVSLEELAAEPMLIQQEGSGVRSVVEAAMRESGVRDRDLKVAMELGLQQSVKAAVLDGFGITVISRLAVERELADGSLVALDARGSRPGAQLLRRAARREDPQAGHPGVRRLRPRGARRHGRARIDAHNVPYHAG